MIVCSIFMYCEKVCDLCRWAQSYCAVQVCAVANYASAQMRSFLKKQNEHSRENYYYYYYINMHFSYYTDNSCARYQQKQDCIVLTIEFVYVVVYKYILKKENNIRLNYLLLFIFYL